jgi:thymidylate synthase
VLVIEGRNVHEIFPEALRMLEKQGVKRNSRNGPVTMFPTPVTTVYHNPTERVMYHPARDANPFFHLAESLWMLGGRNDVDFVSRYVPRMKDYSDDGVTFHGAYGKRWRGHFPMDGNRYNRVFGYRDQLDSIIKDLSVNKDDRRCVLSMWDATVDLGRDGKDFPCNTQATFQVGCDGRLNMMVTNRSNDIIWGAYGANAVQFSMLLEFMARCIEVPVGTYYQVSANFHAYDAVYLNMQEELKTSRDLPSPYTINVVKPYPLMSTPRDVWEKDLKGYLNPHLQPGYSFTEPFFTEVAIPMDKAYWAHKAGRDGEAIDELTAVAATDWWLAAKQWIERRAK